MIPNLAVEVVSKSNTGEEILAKLGDYFQTGTELVWVVYPSARQVYVYTSTTDVRILAEPANQAKRREHLASQRPANACHPGSPQY